MLKYTLATMLNVLFKNDLHHVEVSRSMLRALFSPINERRKGKKGKTENYYCKQWLWFTALCNVLLSHCFAIAWYLLLLLQCFFFYNNICVLFFIFCCMSLFGFAWTQSCCTCSFFLVSPFIFCCKNIQFLFLLDTPLPGVISGV